MLHDKIQITTAKLAEVYLIYTPGYPSTACNHYLGVDRSVFL